MSATGKVLTETQGMTGSALRQMVITLRNMGMLTQEQANNALAMLDGIFLNPDNPGSPDNSNDPDD